MEAYFNMKHNKAERLKYTTKAIEIVNDLTLEQKVWLMSGNIDIEGKTEDDLRVFMAGIMTDGNHYNIEPYEAGGIIESGLPPIKFVDGPRGVVCGNDQSTCFPVSIARGATFDVELENKIGHCIAKETRAFGGNLFAGVCINLPYNPGWGRSQETYGEDSFHIGKMGAALVEGVQDEDVIACIKHYAFNQMENARFKVSITCDQRTEKEVFLPHFKDCIDAGAACVMSSYNRYNGVHCGHNRYLLTDVLKNEWNFDGFVMSDFCWGIRDTVESVNGGQDMEMMWTQWFGKRLVKAVQDNFVEESRIDDACVRIVRTILAFNQNYKACSRSVIGCKEHIDVAKKAAEESITLIKNDGVLPLDRSEVKKVAIIGELANKPVIGDHGSSQVRPAYVVTPIEGLKNANSEAEIIYLDGQDIDEVKKIVSNVDAAIYVVGYNYNDEGEYISEDKMTNYTGAIGGDRKKSLGLHEEDVKLIQETGKVNDKSVVVLIGGDMIMMTDWYKNVNSIIMAYYPGMEGGTALAEIIYGDVNPSGKTPFVIPYNEEDLPYVNWEANNQYYEYYHGYSRLDKSGIKPLVPYGFGLSYTTYKIDDPSVEIVDGVMLAKANITNTGLIAGDQVVQLYIGAKQTNIDRPLKQLRGFTRLSLNPGEKKAALIKVPLDKLQWYDPVYRIWKLEETTYQVYLGFSESEDDLVMTEIDISFIM